MTTITTIQSSDLITNSRADINTNFSNLNTDKIETSYIDTDTTLAANSDTKIASQKAVKAYVDAQGNNFAPTGAVYPFAGSTAPTGHLMADGTAVSRATYADLFTVIGVVYGAGNGTTTFNVPNLKGKIPVGLDSAQVEFDAMAETGGAKTHTLLTAEMPAHTHTQQGQNTTATSGSGVYHESSTSVGYNTAGASTGGGGSHNNLQPYITLNYIIKT